MRTLAVAVSALLLAGGLAAPAAAAPATTVALFGDLQSEAGCPADYDPGCPVTQLTSSTSAPDVWTLSLDLPAGTWSYSLVLDGDLGTQVGQGRTLTLAQATTVLFLYDAATGWVADSANDVIATVTGDQQSELGCGGDFAPDCWRSLLQDPDGDGVGELTVTLPSGTYGAVVTIDGSFDETYGAGGVRNGPNIDVVVPPGATSTSFRYDESTHVLTVLSAVPDTTPPTITGARTPAPGPGGWVRRAVTVTFTCTDSDSGVADVTPPVTVTGEGAGQSVTGSCTDRAGNTASTTVTGISIDRTPPVVGLTSSRSTYDVDSTVSVTCRATDTLSGPASAVCAGLRRPAASFPAGPTSVRRMARDVAGNVGRGSVTIRVVPTARGLCSLTRQWASSGDPGTGNSVSAALTAACRAIYLREGGTASERQRGLERYRAAVQVLRHQGALSAAEQTTLVAFARAV
jgi:hypothetical protein